MFPEEVLQEYIKHYSDPACVHAIAEDYRASNSIDLIHDEKDRKRTISTPLLVLWGENAVVGNIWNVLKSWKKFASNVEDFGVKNCGHFVPEEQPKIVLDAVIKFLEKNK